MAMDDKDKPATELEREAEETDSRGKDERQPHSDEATGEELEQPEGEEHVDSNDLVHIEEATPSRVIVLPLQKAVPFPGLMMPVQLASDHARAVVAKAEDQGGFLCLLAREPRADEASEHEQPRQMVFDDSSADEVEPDSLYRVGVVARVLKLLNLPDGEQAVLLQGLKRVRRERILRRRPFLIMRVENLEDIPRNDMRTEAQIRNLQEILKKIVERSQHLDDQFMTAALNVELPGHLADFCAAYLIRDLKTRQRVLEAQDLGDRLDIVVESLTRELTLLELGQRIQDEIRQKIEKAQKEFFLREQIKIIRRELGEEVDAKQAEINRLAEEIDAAGFNEEVRAKTDEELERLKVTPVESPEHTVIRNHLDWMLSLPWSKSSDDRKDIRNASKVLEEDHYGLKIVKQRILEFLAVRKLKESHAGPILCLAGPPGVGKTSLGRSIARAMGREFWRFSLGGMRDEAEIKGHRRTYVGAMPGRILQGLKTCGTNNPVMMLDEVDKLGADFRGDPASALLEVLDPEQNHAFLDHYIDVPFDLSRVFFVATANVLANIPPPLRDRMEIIEIPGYLTKEKVEIARRHLLPKQLLAHGLTKRQLSLSARVLDKIVEHYTREAGVRGLEKCIARICRKTALDVARRRKRKGAAVSVDELTTLLGQPRYSRGGERRVRGPGICQGLAWTPAGGEVLFIEAISWPGGGEIKITGQLGEVMRESVTTASSYLRGRAELFGLDLDKISSQDLHIHFPAGSIPKDGPSAGITIATALLSLWLNKRCPKDLAMTGELTLVGEVLPIGGVREKVLAARREGIKRVILPAENRADVEEIGKDLVKGLKFIYVDTFEEVWAVLGW